MSGTDLVTVVGFLRIVVGLAVLVLVVWWVSRRNHRAAHGPAAPAALLRGSVDAPSRGRRRRDERD